MAQRAPRALQLMNENATAVLANRRALFKEIDDAVDAAHDELEKERSAQNEARPELQPETAAGRDATAESP